jgi:leucyl/phenylalanyl-tRNA---protein transferase
VTSAQPPRRSRFPDPRTVPADAPFAYGENYDPDVLLDAYRHGIFPWPIEDEVYWWSPDPRAVIPLDGLRVSRSLRRRVRSGEFRCTADQAFRAVMRACSSERGEESWITPAYMEGYGRLHDLGAAHSIEVWAGEDLVGGLYGVTVGAVFTGESMFHRRTDASKVALVALRDRLVERGFGLLDAQLPTEHLTTMGAVTIPREEFLDRLAELVDRPVTFA